MTTFTRSRSSRVWLPITALAVAVLATLSRTTWAQDTNMALQTLQAMNSNDGAAGAGGSSAPGSVSAPTVFGNIDATAQQKPSAASATGASAAAAAVTQPESFVGGPATADLTTAVNRKNCSLSVQTEAGSSFEFENCVYLQGGGGFTFHWTYDRPTRILDAAYSSEWDGWVGWGIGVRMVGASALVAFRTGEAGYYVSRYYLEDYNASVIEPNTGDLMVVPNSIKVHIQGRTVRVLFAVTLPPEQSSGLYVILAKGGKGDPSTGRLEPHSPLNTAKAYLKLAGAGPPQWLQAAHGAVNMLSWGFLMPAGVLIARHLRESDPVHWLPLHRRVQAASYLLGAFGFFLGLLMWGDAHEGRTRLRGVGGEEEGEFNPAAHRRYAVIIFLLASFQVTAYLMHPHKDAILRPWWNVLHHWTGRLIVLLSIINVWEGIALLHPHSMVWSFLYGIPFGLLVIVASLLEAFSLWKWLMDDSPTTSLQRWVQSVVPPSLHRRYMSLQPGVEAASPVDLSDGEIEFMASKFRQELEYKYM